MSAKWWAVYRGCQYIEHVLAISGQRAMDVVAERQYIDRDQLRAVHDAERFVLCLLPDSPLTEADLGMLPFYSQELGPEFSEPGPADPGKEV